MKGKNVAIKAGLSLGAVVSLALALVVGSNNTKTQVNYAENHIYSITFDQNQNWMMSPGFPFVYSPTELGNIIVYSLHTFVDSYDEPAGIWHAIKPGGVFENYKPISGIASLTIEKNNSDAHLRIYYSAAFENLYDGNYVEFDATSPLIVTTNFNNEYPNFFGIEAIGPSNAEIKRMELKYLCVDYYQIINVSENNSLLGSVSGGGEYRNGNTVTLTATPNAGASFVGWYENGVLLDPNPIYTFQAELYERNIEGRFEGLPFNLAVSSRNANQGNVTGSGVYNVGDKVTISATPLEGWYFEGWYDEANNLVSRFPTKTLRMSSSDVTYYASFSDVVQPPLPTVGEPYYFGSYPQDEVTDTELIATLNSLSGALPSASDPSGWTSYRYYRGGVPSDYMWYIDIAEGGEKYRGVYFTDIRPPQPNTIPGSSHNSYELSKVYWFKYAPISWDVLSVDEEAGPLLNSTKVLDAQEYYHDNLTIRKIDGKPVTVNNYKESDIRTWLNNEFYNTAFSEEEKLALATTRVDNGPDSMEPSHDEHGNIRCSSEDTFDKIYLLSYQEVTNPNYGFPGNTSDTEKRAKIATDYAQALNVRLIYGTQSARWWTRSPIGTIGYISRYATVVNYYGSLYSNHEVHEVLTGVSPAIRLKF